MQKAETPRELVSYNLMEYFRKKLNKPFLCKLDFSKEQKEVFKCLVNKYLKEGKLCNNPFKDKKRLLIIELEKD